MPTRRLAERIAMNTVYRRLPNRQPKAVAIAKAAPQIPVPVLAFVASGALALIITLALRGLL